MVSFRRVILGLVALASPACASSSSVAARSTASSSLPDDGRGRTNAFVRVEDEALGWLAAADPRLAARTDSTAPDSVLRRIGMEAVLAEDATAQIHGGSLDLFAFRARALALAEAVKVVSAFREPLPDAGPLGTTLARPQLERELLERLIEAEQARAAEEEALGEASGELVRGIVSTWTTPTAPQDWPERDAWASKHLLEIRDSLRRGEPHTGPSELDAALYPLERLLAPLQFPHGAAAIAEVRMTLDNDMRAVPPVAESSRVAREATVYLGVRVDPVEMRPRLERIEARLRELARVALESAGPGRPQVEARARELLLVQRSCPSVRDSRVRSMAPPPEREAICGALEALSEEEAAAARASAIVALHDDVVLSFASIVRSPPLHTGLLSKPDDEDIAGLARTARERPVMALGVALAAELLYGGASNGEERVHAWRALGDAPLDVVARELGEAAPSPPPELRSNTAPQGRP